MDRIDIKELVRSVKAGGVVVYPTETLYAIGCGAMAGDAVKRVYEIKNRPVGKPLPLIIGSVDQLELVTSLVDDLLLSLAKCFWPGPLSILVKAKDELCPQVKDRDGFTSVRVSPHPVAKKLALMAETPLVATSANISGGDPAARPEELDDRILNLADFFFLAGPFPGGGDPSTVIRCFSEGYLEILRHGAIPKEALLARGFKIV